MPFAFKGLFASHGDSLCGRCGAPLIGFAGGGAHEVVTDEVDGLLVGPGSVKDLAHAVRRVAGDRAPLRRLGAEAIVRSKGRFTFEEPTARADQTLIEAGRPPRARANEGRSSIRRALSSRSEGG